MLLPQAEQTSSFIPLRRTSPDQGGDHVRDSTREQDHTHLDGSGTGSVAPEDDESPALWVDVETRPKRRRKSKRLTSERLHKRKAEVLKPESDTGRFWPKLSRILESSEVSLSSKTGARASEREEHGEKSSRRTRASGDIEAYKDSSALRSGGVPRGPFVISRANPSLLSVSSALTSASSRSSGSNSTITQRTYDRRRSRVHGMPSASARHSSVSSISSSRGPPSLAALQSALSLHADEHRDSHSMRSSSSSVSSHYQPSDAGSSDAPDTPSSRSSFPSPTATRSGSVAELRRKYDPQYSGHENSLGSSPKSAVRSSRRQPSVSDVIEDGDEDEPEPRSSPPSAPSDLRSHRDQHTSPDSYAHYQHSSEYPHYLRDPQQHTDYYQYPPQHYIQPHCTTYRSHSTSSHRSDGSSPPQPSHQALQPYYQPPHLPHAPSPPSAVPSLHYPQPLPPAPEPPSLPPNAPPHGYDRLARAIASESPDSAPPLYRKFGHLHHRILLHLQDELAELEEQLASLDAMASHLAQPLHSSGQSEVEVVEQSVPASRRQERYLGGVYAQRVDLLGKIYLKMEQYSKAVKAASEAEDGWGCESLQAGQSDDAAEIAIESYRKLVQNNAGICEPETGFLERKTDLIILGRRKSTELVEVRGWWATNGKTALGASFGLLALLLFLPGRYQRLVLGVVIGAAGALALRQLNRGTLARLRS
ncbi:hypothetical protein B0A48_10669 [Cryoendolithus antarcticus]|uniref:DUF6594 domain-containing protein n=1 Tax=Cryoendolithus antarcticus TaxID=1507870 RepID=A0A1V8SXZ2_9PEZI|nr:hypothetical protein B0A48_10669 [Cryoendolithus antarcticus]